MYKNLNEMAAHKKGLWPEVVVPKIFFLCILLCLNAGNSFFQSTVFLYFTEVVVVIHAVMDTVFILEKHLQSWIVYIQCTWQIFLFKKYWNLKGALAAIYLKSAVIVSGGRLQWSSIFKGIVFLWDNHLQSSLISKILS